MNNNSGLAEAVMNRTDSQMNYLTIEREASVREESLRNFSFDGGNKNYKEEAIAYINNYTPLT